MSNGRHSNTGTNQRTTTVLRDINRDPILEIGLEEYIVRHADGSITFYRRSDNIQLADGTQWNPGFLTTNPPVFVGVCQQCRMFSFRSLHIRKPCHGITTLGRAKLCADCGILCCPNHRILSTRDQKWRCLGCAKKHSVKEFIKSIFFVR
jgi:hypothetical protein